MIINVHSRLKYNVLAPTTFIFNIAAASTQRQTILSELLTLQPKTEVLDDLVDLPENRIYRLLSEGPDLEIEYQASVEIDAHKNSDGDLDQEDHMFLPDEALPYLYPSRYCPSDRLNRWATKTFGTEKPGSARVRAICDWIFDELDYVPGVTDQHTDAW